MTSAILALLFTTTSAQFDLPKDLLSSLCYIESTHNINAVHKDDGNSNSVGICQIKWTTAKWLGFTGTEKQLMDPKINIYYAGKYLKHQINRYKGSVPRAVTAYNKGHSSSDGNNKYYRKVLYQWRNNGIKMAIRDR